MFSNLLALAVTEQDIVAEIARLQRNFEFLCYGFAAAWVILVGYVLLLVARERKIRREMRDLNRLLEYREKKA